METNYSVLMSVYYKENPEYLHTSMKSMLSQTVKTDDYVLVCDGPLTAELNSVIADMQQQIGSMLNVIRLEKNGGLGNALNVGIKQCKNMLVARMDSDDISYSNRCELQLQAFRENAIDMCSGTINEFKLVPEVILGKRELPLTNECIMEFSKKRNPFNHMAMMFKKSAVIAAGGYSENYHLFEDYYLWVRMLQKGFTGMNLVEPLVNVRTSSDMYLRRGGKNYANDMLKFHWWMHKTGWTSFFDFCTGALPHAVVCLVPNKIRGMVYKALRT